MKNKIIVQNQKITIRQHDKKDFISLTDIARYKDSDRSDYILQNWMRNRETIEFLGLWEKINNDDFNSIEFDGIKNKSGVNSFILTPKQWISSTNAIGIISKAGRYGGTFAHRDIAFEFASWISAEFKLFLIKEFQRLKEDEIQSKSLEWDLSRSLSKINYKIHTDAIKEHLIPNIISKPKEGFIYANEADVLNVALFGMIAKQWREANSNKDGNIRDYASVEQLIVLSNMESINAELIKRELSQSDRLIALNEVAISQIKSLINNPTVKKLGK
ncbi:MAG: KilA-N domain-containing protein [Campylobacterota bacterium]|nr:KilA-N domain-containing protein [Campylobacterota bacterium]